MRIRGSVKKGSCAGEDELMQTLNKLLFMRAQPETAAEAASCNLESSLTQRPAQTALSITAESS